MLLLVKESFLTVWPPKLKTKERLKKIQVSRIFKGNKNRGEISLYNSTINQLFQYLLCRSLWTISLSQTDLKQHKQKGHTPEDYSEPCQQIKMKTEDPN